ALGQILLIPDDSALRRKLDNTPVHVAVPEQVAAATFLRRRRKLAVEELRVGSIRRLHQVSEVDIALGIKTWNRSVQTLPDDRAPGLAILADDIQRDELPRVLRIPGEILARRDNVEFVGRREGAKGQVTELEAHDATDGDDVAVLALPVEIPALAVEAVEA